MFKSRRRQYAPATYDLDNLQCFIAVNNGGSISRLGEFPVQGQMT